jgi:hypothetical protein
MIAGPLNLYPSTFLLVPNSEKVCKVYCRLWIFDPGLGGKQHWELVSCVHASCTSIPSGFESVFKLGISIFLLILFLYILILISQGLVC